MRSTMLLLTGVAVYLLGTATTGRQDLAPVGVLLLTVGGVTALVGIIGTGVRIGLTDARQAGAPATPPRPGSTPGAEKPVVGDPTAQRVIDALWDTDSQDQRQAAVLAPRLGMTRRDLREAVAGLLRAGHVVRDPAEGHYDVVPAADPAGT